MDSYRQTHHSARVYRGLTLLILIFLLQPISTALGSSHGITRSAVVTIMGKTTDAVTISERNFVVSESTVIVDVSGEKISLNDLAVPCTAEVKYQLRMDKDPLCLQIHVQKLQNVSRQNWSSSDQEGGK